jgi:hypothetical protein
LSTPITNADTGVLISWEEDTPAWCAYTATDVIGLDSNGNNIYQQVQNGCENEATAFNLATTQDTTLASTSTINIPGQTAPVQSIVQREDGSYVGSGGAGMIAFTGSGQVLWTVPNDTPQIATADGGVIGTSGITYDQNGVATGMLASLPILSWKGAYQLGSAESVVPPAVTILPSFLAFPGGNFTGNGTSDVIHTFGLFWCGTAYAEQGHCSGQTDVTFGYVANPNDSNISTIQNQNFDPAHRDWIGMIEAKALSSFKAAFAKKGIMVQLANGGEEFTVHVVGNWPAPAIGFEFPYSVFFGNGQGRLYYLAIMDDAQMALGQPGPPPTDSGWVPLAPTYPPNTQQDLQDFQKLIAAIGTAIGNAAAHETGHYLESLNSLHGKMFQYLDCGLGNTQVNPAFECEKGDNFVCNFFSASGLPQDPNNTKSVGGMFFYGVPGADVENAFHEKVDWLQTPIHWSPTNDCWLQNYGAPGSCKQQ